MQTQQRQGKISLRAKIVCAALVGIGYLVLAPVYNRIWYRVNQATCSTHLKAVGVAMQLYAKDSGDHLPPVFSGGATVGWAGAVQPYLKEFSPGLIMSTWPFECPYDATKRNESPASPGFSDYWYNANVMRKSAGGVTTARLAQMKSPTQTILVGCGGSMTSGTGYNATFNLCGNDTALIGGTGSCEKNSVGDAVYLHALDELDGKNFLFGDGHVKWLKGNSTSQSAQVLNNGATLANIGGKVSLSLLEG